jgi:hypothetical protein
MYPHPLAITGGNGDRPRSKYGHDRLTDSNFCRGTQARVGPGLSPSFHASMSSSTHCRPHIYNGEPNLGFARGKEERGLWIRDATVAPPPAVRRAPPPSPRRRPSGPHMRIERCSGSRFAQISSSFGSCNPESDQLLLELQSAINRLLWERQSEIKRHQPRLAINAARFLKSCSSTTTLIRFRF